MAARFYEQEIRSGLKDRRRLSSFLEQLIRRHRKRLEAIRLLYIFCQDEYLLQINRDFLGHDDLTDIITFDLSEDEYRLEAEVYISIDRVKENAVLFKTSYQRELHRVIFHGALHLCGFKDKSASAKKLMRQMEEDCLKKYFKGS